MKKNESKYFYTAQLMNQALLSLLEKKDIEFITITEITNKAGVSRSTFYLHYEDKEDLIKKLLDDSSSRIESMLGYAEFLKYTTTSTIYL